MNMHTTENARELCKIVIVLTQNNHNTIWLQNPKNDTFIGFVGSNVDALKFSSSRSEYQKIVLGSLEEAATSSSSDSDSETDTETESETESESESSPSLLESGFTFPQAQTSCRSEYVLQIKIRSAFHIFFSGFAI